MKLLAVVAQIFRSVRKPMHVNEITERVILSGLWESKGKTPDATIGARIYHDIVVNGENSVFVKVGPGTFSLKEFTSGREAHLAPTQKVNDNREHSLNTSNSLNSLSDDSERYDTDLADTVEKEALEDPLVKENLSFVDSAEKVLDEFGNKKPMHYKEITKIALEKGWLVTTGKTPDASMSSSLYLEITRQQKSGKLPRFIKHERGYYGLSKWIETGLVSKIEGHNQKVREELHKSLLEMDPYNFEKIISRLLEYIGFETVKVTKRSNDGGIDVRGTLVVGNVVRIKMAVQVKKWALNTNIPAPVVQQVRGSLGIHEQGLIITTSDFSKGARNEAAQPDKSPIALMNGKELVLLLMEHDIGVSRFTTDLFDLSKDDLMS
ncbi:MAG: restriction endonuclease [Deltaproteobacteria bacterium]|jgi:restriction system protein|nr:restriction endonuclease [Deltaproteobacteria bacterium]